MTEPEQQSRMSRVITGARERFESLRRFFLSELWDLDLSALPRVRKFAFSLVRVVVIVVRGFVNDNCALQSSALTFTTLMSMVPVLALAFSMAKGLGAQDRLMGLIGLEPEPLTEARGSQAPPGTDEFGLRIVEGGSLSTLPPQAQEMIVRMFESVERTNFSVLGSIGSLLLLWTVVRTMSKVERTFNLIWGVRQARPVARKVADFISVLVIVPILLLASTSVNAVLASSRIVELAEVRLGPLFWVYQRALGLTGLVSLCVAFSLLYIFMPNTRVKLLPALAAGIIGGCLWFAAQKTYFVSQGFVTRQSAIYGTFAAVPFFLLWVYVSWTVVLFGAEVAFAIQNCATYVFESEAADVEYETRERLGFVVVHEVCRCFADPGDEPWHAGPFAKQHGVPVRLMADVLFTLTSRRILIAVNEREGTYVPGRDPGRISLFDVWKAFRGDPDPRIADLLSATDTPALRQAIETHRTVTRQALDTVTLRDLILTEDPQAERSA
jgi:membrane protein